MSLDNIGFVNLSKTLLVSLVGDGFESDTGEDVDFPVPISAQGLTLLVGVEIDGAGIFVGIL